MADYPGYGEGMSGGGIMSVLEPFGNYLNEQIDTQRVDPFLETVSNAAYQEFGIKPNQGGGGGFFSGGFYKDGGGGMPNPFSNMPPPLPPVQQPIMNTEPSGPVAGMSNFGPDIGNGGLFSGGPMSGGTPMQLPGPRIPTFIDMEGNPTGNGPIGSFSQGPLDFTDGSNIAQPALGGNVGEDFAASAQNYFNPGGGQSAFGPMGARPEQMVERAQARLAQRDVKPPEVMAYLNNVIKTGGVPTMMAPQPSTNFSSLMGVGPDGGVNSGQMPPGFTPLPPGELGFTEDIGPFQAYTGGSKTFNESAPYPISLELARRKFG
jgi:hypothetical protein